MNQQWFTVSSVPCSHSCQKHVTASCDSQTRHVFASLRLDLNSDPCWEQDSDSDPGPEPSVPGPGYVLVVSDSEVRLEADGSAGKLPVLFSPISPVSLSHCHTCVVTRFRRAGVLLRSGGLRSPSLSISSSVWRR